MDFTRHMTAAFRKMGEAATYTPPVGQPVTCRAMRTSKALRYGWLELPVAGVCFDLLRGEVTPEVGGTLTVGGQVYPVDSPPLTFPPDQDPQGLRWRLMSGWGSPAVYRASDGDSPPRGSEWIVADDAEAGATAISVAGTLAAGRVVAGDAFALDGHPAPYVAAGGVDAAGGAFTAIPVSPALAAPVATGTAVSPAWGRDIVLRALPLAAAAGLAGGTLDMDGRWLVIADALRIGGDAIPPRAGDQFTVEGDTLEVAGWVPHRVSGLSVLLWELRLT